MLTIIALSSTGILDEKTSQLIDNLGQLGAGGAAAACCWWTWRRAATAERDQRWRMLLACGMTGWTCGMAVWSWYQVALDSGLPSPSLADVGFLMLPAFALPALLTLPSDPASDTASVPDADVMRHHRHQRRARLFLALDATVVVGSLFVLTWATALGAVVRAGGANPLAFGVAVAYPLTDAALVVLALLLMVFRKPRRPAALLVLGAGLVALSVSDSFFLYLISQGAGEMPPMFNIGGIVGPVLIALSTLMPEPPAARGGEGRDQSSTGWSLLVPYLPLSAVGLLVLVQQSVGTPVGSVEVYGLVLLVGTVVARQFLTLWENLELLGRVRDRHHRLRRQAFHDALTGLANRTLFHHRLEEALRHHHDDGRGFALMYVDLDDFKLVNDTLGHSEGDELLRRTGDRLRACVRAGDTVARLGGDEFALIVSSQDHDLAEVGRQVLAAVEGAAVPVEPTDETSKASVGAVVVPQMTPSDRYDGPELTADVLLHRADTAMYAAKRAGKGRMTLFDVYAEDWLPAPASCGIDTGIVSGYRPTRQRKYGRHLAASSTMRVGYRPVVRLVDGCTVAVHTVVPHLTMQPARSVLEAVLDVVCRDLANLRTHHDAWADLAAYVDLPVARLLDPYLAGRLVEATSWRGLPADALVISIAPTRPVAQTRRIAEALEEVRRAGIRVALDDFGAGHSNLDQLLTLPIDVLQLHHGLLSPNVDPARADGVGAAVVHLARGLGMPLVAQGIETPQQATWLARLGCDLGRGPVFGDLRSFDDLVPRQIDMRDNSIPNYSAHSASGA
ncbi:MAG: diguanylate cyclase domain-containing protein [Angustibacter sp.]